MPAVINMDELTDVDKAKMSNHYFVRQTSKCCTEFMEAVQAGVEEDTLVKGIAEDKNPFKELKGGCVVC
ncbi:guanine nucleotide-binding protein G(T) subunit gamma-T1-like [Oncorhynchus masou masou]|uniref:guanine nucleotide-binding protein G(T) subunit gamma-T1-like n=1 Tax=Oncorhynchus masou masou TaxID=90313 RepID=UPI003184583F